MRNTSTLVGFLATLFMTGCAAVGVISSSDPLVKLNDAEALISMGRPVPAERLIREALDIYQQRGDAHGLAAAHRQYADLLISGAVVKNEVVYRRSGFQDKSVTYDTRLEKAKDYYKKALGYYETAAKEHISEKQYDLLTNVYFNMGWCYQVLEDRKNACGYYDKALEAYNQNRAQNPKARQLGSLPESVKTQKQQVHCD